MSSYSLAEAAAWMADWIAAWNDVHDGFKKQFGRVGLDKPVIWARLQGDRDRLVTLLSSMQLLDGVEEATSRVDTCEALQQSARTMGSYWTKGLARMSDFQVSIDGALADKRRRLERSSVSCQGEGHPCPRQARRMARKDLSSGGSGRGRARLQECGGVRTGTLGQASPLRPSQPRGRPLSSWALDCYFAKARL